MNYLTKMRIGEAIYNFKDNEAAQQVEDERLRAIGEENKKLDAPNSLGNPGDVLMKDAQGNTVWDVPPVASAEEIHNEVYAYLAEHHDETINLNDDSVAIRKLEPSLRKTILTSRYSNSISYSYQATYSGLFYSPLYNVDNPTEPEGLAYIKTVNSRDFVLAFYSSINGAGGAGVENANVTINEYRIDQDPRNNILVRSVTMSGLDHANGATYNPNTNEVYVALCMYDDANGNHVREPLIAVLDYNTLEIQRYITVTVNGVNTTVNLVSYDRSNNKLYANVFINSHTEVVEVDPTTGNATVLLDMTAVKGTNYYHADEGFCVVDGLVFRVSGQPRAITVYDIAEQKIVKHYDLPITDEDGHFYGFPQDLDYNPLTGDFYQLSFCKGAELGNQDGVSGGNPYFNYLVKFNLFTGVTSNSKSSNKGSIITGPSNIEVYVDSSVTSIYQTGTRDYPFKSITEGVGAILKSPANNKFLRVADGTYPEYVYFEGINCLVLGGNVHVYALYIRSSIIRFENYWEIDGTGFSSNALSIYSSQVSFANFLKVSMVTTSDAQVIRMTDSIVRFNGGAGIYTNRSGNYIYAVRSSLVGFKNAVGATCHNYKFNSVDIPNKFFTQSDNYTIEITDWANLALRITNGSSYNFISPRWCHVRATIGITTSDGATRYFDSSSQIFTGNDNFKLFISTWYGVVTLTFNASLQLQSIVTSYISNQTEADRVTGYVLKTLEIN